MNRLRRRRAAFAAVAILAGEWLLPSAVVASGKLITMKNGRVLRAEKVRTEGEDLVAVLEGGHTMEFPSVVVAAVEDDLAGNETAAGPLNVIRSGRDGGGGGGFTPPMQAQPEPVQDEAIEAPPPEVAVPVQDSNVNGAGMVVDENPRTPVGPPNAPPGPNGRNRRVGRLGFKPRPGDN